MTVKMISAKEIEYNFNILLNAYNEFSRLSKR
jgi:hypothetical protein